MTRTTVLVTALLFAAPALAQKGGAKDEEAIKAVVNGFVDGWNKHDAKVLTGAFADDGSVINPGGRVARGKAEIEKLFTEEQAGPMLKDSTMAMTVSNTRMVKPDVAFIDIDADLAGMKSPDGKPMPGKHHIAVVAVKKAGKWLLEDIRPYMFAWPPPGMAAKPAAAPAPAKK